jgi:uncharacterized oxidoreductase
MDLASNTVLMTGGASGIGFALAERFLHAGSDVIVCGRREDKLRQAKGKHREIAIHAADIETAAGRFALFKWAVADFPRLNVLIKNAGIQRRGVRLTETVTMPNGRASTRKSPSTSRLRCISHGSSFRIC